MWRLPDERLPPTSGVLSPAAAASAFSGDLDNKGLGGNLINCNCEIDKKESGDI